MAGEDERTSFSPPSLSQEKTTRRFGVDDKLLTKQFASPKPPLDPYLTKSFLARTEFKRKTSVRPTMARSGMTLNYYVTEHVRKLEGPYGRPVCYET